MGQLAGPVVVFAVALAIWYVLFIFPQQKRAREHQDVLKAVKPGDEVVTYGGIFAVVKEVQEDWFILTVSEGVDLKVAREAVVMRRSPEEEDDGATV